MAWKKLSQCIEMTGMRNATRSGFVISFVLALSAEMPSTLIARPIVPFKALEATDKITCGSWVGRQVQRWREDSLRNDPVLGRLFQARPVNFKEMLARFWEIENSLTPTQMLEYVEGVARTVEYELLTGGVLENVAGHYHNPAYLDGLIELVASAEIRSFVLPENSRKILNELLPVLSLSEINELGWDWPTAVQYQGLGRGREIRRIRAKIAEKGKIQNNQLSRIARLLFENRMLILLLHKIGKSDPLPPNFSILDSLPYVGQELKMKQLNENVEDGNSALQLPPS